MLERTVYLATTVLMLIAEAYLVISLLKDAKVDVLELLSMIGPTGFTVLSTARLLTMFDKATNMILGVEKVQ